MYRRPTEFFHHAKPSISNQLIGKKYKAHIAKVSFDFIKCHYFSSNIVLKTLHEVINACVYFAAWIGTCNFA